MQKHRLALSVGGGTAAGPCTLSLALQCQNVPSHTRELSRSPGFSVIWSQAMGCSRVRAETHISGAGVSGWVRLFFAASGGKRQSNHKYTHISPWSLLTSAVQQLMKEKAVADLKFPLNPAAHEYLNPLYSFEDCCRDSWLLHGFVRDSKSSV